MKKLLCIICGVLVVVSLRLSTSAQTKTWTGGGDGRSWSDAANWSGAGVPDSTHEVILDNSTVLTSYTVNLPTASNPKIKRLVITPDSSYTITLVLPSGNTGNPGFTVGDGATTIPYDIVLNSGAVLRNSSGASSGNGIAFASNKDSMFIANGGRYVHNTARGNALIVAQLARASGTESGVFEFDVPGTGLYQFSATGRTYGSLVLSAVAAGGTKRYSTYSTTGSSATSIRGNLTIGSGVTWTSGLRNVINLFGNVTNNGALVDTAAQAIQLVGTLEQTVGGVGTYSLKRLRINNSAGVTLTSPLSVSDSLILSLGKVTIGSNSIVIASSGGADPGSPSSYVVTAGTGTVTQKGVGSTDRYFPVGTATSYNPVILKNIGTVDTFAVRVQPTYDFPPNDSSKVVNRQWTITESVPGGSNVTIGLQWNTNDQASGFNPSQPVYIGRFSGEFWLQTLATVFGVGPYLAQASGFTSFSAFGVGNEDALPIQLASFTGTIIAGNRVRLDWQTASEVNNYGFYIQRRAANVGEWTEIDGSFVPGHGTTYVPQYYSYTDHVPLTAARQYRLRQVDLDGTSHFTDPIQVDNPTSVPEVAPRVFTLMQNYPNPFNPSTEIKFSVETTNHARLEVYNTLGQKVATLFDGIAEAGQYHKVRFNASGLSSGVYFYRLVSGNRTDSKKLTLLR